MTSLIHSGPLEEIRLAGPTTAFVLFLDPTDAANFYNATANGIDCHKEGAKYVVLTEMNPGDVDVVGGKLRQWIDTGMTRCVRVVGVAGEWTVGRLYVLAEGKNRKVEAIEDGVNPGGVSFSMTTLTMYFVRITLTSLPHSFGQLSSVSAKSTMPSNSRLSFPGLMTGNTATSTSRQIGKSLPSYTLC